MSSLTWKCADGREISIQEMSDTHLENAIRMLQTGRRKNGESIVITPARARALRHLLVELAARRRGDSPTRSRFSELDLD